MTGSDRAAPPRAALAVLPVRLARALAAVLVLAAVPTAAGAVAFSQADLDHDGYVTFEEAVKSFPGLKRVQFKKCDPNRDGRLDQYEFPLLNSFYWIMDEG